MENELKTLQEILREFASEYNQIGMGLVIGSKLKAEAIKWIKPKAGTELTKEQAIAYRRACDFIRYFFNITSADLQEKTDG